MKRSPRRAILTYHSIDRTGSPISIDPETFERTVAWLASDAVEPVPLDEGILAAGDDSRSRHRVAVTFDDGFRNFTEAWPILSDHDVPATLFVVSGQVGRDNRWGDRSTRGIPDLPLLDWDELGRLAEAGVSLGAHGCTHANLRTLSGAALEDEVAQCADEIEKRCGARPRVFAYAYGAVSSEAYECAARHYDLAVTTRLGFVEAGDDRHRLPRLDTFYFRRPARLHGIGTGAVDRYLASRRILRRVRRMFFEDGAA